ncbi:MAG: zinc-binding dehydrogenase [Niastella sp.]|uniref:zinc-binding dehydrogenase n=1 Tax=Niastella sp. TaxID=1869183 RepID=UPI00389B396B
MEAYLLAQNGGIEKLKKVTMPTPGIQTNEVLIKTKAIGINPIDIQVRNSKDILGMITHGNIPQQVVLGWDVAGVVEQTGEGVNDFKPGDEVYGLLNMPGLGNTYATYVTADARQLAHKPAALDFVAAGATPMAAMTAWQAVVTRGHVKHGEKVLIHAASGGVGHFAVQIAKYLGAYVIGTASAKNKNFVMELGADEFIDYTEKPFEKQLQKVDVVIDTINSVEHILRSISVLKKGGRLVYLQPHFQSAIEAQLLAAEVSGSGVFVNSSGEVLAEISKLIREGHVLPKVTQVFGFNELPQAQAAVESGRATGKVVVSVNDHTKEDFIKALTQEEINTIYDFYGVFSKRDYNEVDRILAPDWKDIPLAPGQLEGPTGFKELVRNFTTAFPDLIIKVHEVFGTHERAGVRAEMSFTHSSEFMGIAPTHKKLTVAIHEFHYLKDGKLTTTWHLEDWLSMLLQTGAWPVNGQQ